MIETFCSKRRWFTSSLTVAD